MRLAQDNCFADFPTFMTTLARAASGLPNIHIARRLADMGAGDGSIAGCDATGGKNGIFQYTARGNAARPRTCRPARRTSPTSAASPTTPATLADVFTCIAALGETGCGFEHQFAAILRALGADGKAAPAENQGFLRPDAYLAIVMLTNEDDCSATPGVPLFDTGSNTNLASQLGPAEQLPLQRVRAPVHDGPAPIAHPGRSRPTTTSTATVTYNELHVERRGGLPAERQRTPRTRIKALKADPSQVARRRRSRGRRRRTR